MVSCKYQCLSSAASLELWLEDNDGFGCFPTTAELCTFFLNLSEHDGESGTVSLRMQQMYIYLMLKKGVSQCIYSVPGKRWGEK